MRAWFFSANNAWATVTAEESDTLGDETPLEAILPEKQYVRDSL